MTQITVFVFTQRHIRTSRGGGCNLEPKDILFPGLTPIHPVASPPKSYILQKAFPEGQEPACIFFPPTKGPQDSPNFLSCSQLGVVEGAQALESEDLDLRPGLSYN